MVQAGACTPGMCVPGNRGCPPAAICLDGALGEAIWVVFELSSARGARFLIILRLTEAAIRSQPLVRALTVARGVHVAADRNGVSRTVLCVGAGAEAVGVLFVAGLTRRTVRRRVESSRACCAVREGVVCVSAGANAVTLEPGNGQRPAAAVQRIGAHPPASWVAKEAGQAGGAVVRCIGVRWAYTAVCPAPRIAARTQTPHSVIPHHARGVIAAVGNGGARKEAVRVVLVAPGTRPAIVRLAKILVARVARCAVPFVAAVARAVRTVASGRICMAVTVGVGGTELFANRVVDVCSRAGATSGRSVVVRGAIIALGNALVRPRECAPLVPARAVATCIGRPGNVHRVAIAVGSDGAQRTAVWVDPRVVHVAVVAVEVRVVGGGATCAVRRSGPRVPAGALTIWIQSGHPLCVATAVECVRANPRALGIVGVAIGATSAVDRFVVTHRALTTDISIPLIPTEAGAPRVCVP